MHVMNNCLIPKIQLKVQIWQQKMRIFPRIEIHRFRIFVPIKSLLYGYLTFMIISKRCVTIWINNWRLCRRLWCHTKDLNQCVNARFWNCKGFGQNHANWQREGGPLLTHYIKSAWLCLRLPLHKINHHSMLLLLYEKN